MLDLRRYIGISVWSCLSAGSNVGMVMVSWSYQRVVESGGSGKEHHMWQQILSTQAVLVVNQAEPTPLPAVEDPMADRGSRWRRQNTASGNSHKAPRYDV